MHARELVELAALASFHGEVFLQDASPLDETSVERYWSASKCRLDRWGRTLKRLSGTACRGSKSKTPRGLGVLEEILSGEVLTRVWTALTVAQDRRRHGDASSVTRSILACQLESRNRALSYLVDSPAMPAESVAHLNRLRRRAESWTDLLVGYLSVKEDMTEFANDADRSQDFAADFREDSRREWPLLLASLRASFSTAFRAASPNADLNDDIAASVMACFPARLFDSTGLLRTLRMSRLEHAASETHVLIESLFSAEHEWPSDRAASDHSFFNRRFCD